jgi:hypothetical protein
MAGADSDEGAWAMSISEAKQEGQRAVLQALLTDDELAAFHVWMAPAWQEEMQRAAQKSLAVMCPACSRSPDGLLALMESANRVATAVSICSI